MKILFSNSNVIYRGAWGRTFPLSEELVRMGNEVTIITMCDKPSLSIKSIVINGVTVVVFPSIFKYKSYYDPISVILKIIYVLFHKYDIVHSDIGQRPQSGLPCRISKKVKKTVYISDWMDYNGIGGQYDNKSKLFKLIFGKYELKWEYKDRQVADGVVVLSDLLFKEAINVRSDNDVIKIHGGTLVDKIPYEMDTNPYKLNLDIKEDIITFGYIDASTTISEIKPLIDAIISLNICDRVKLLIFGGNLSKPLDVPEIIKKNIIRFGWVDFYKQYEKLLAVDVFVLLKEDTKLNRAGWPNALGDYMACGRPILISPVGEVVEFVNCYPEGFFITDRKVESVKKIINIISAKKERMLEMGKINRKIAEEVISWRVKSHQLYNFYKQIIDKKQNQR